MSQSSDDTPIAPIGGKAQQPRPDSARRRPDAAAAVRPAAGDPTRRWNTIRDLAAAALLVVALFLPWNLFFGVGIPGSNSTLFAVLLAVTLLSLISVALTGTWRSSGGWFNPVVAGWLRLGLNVPYVLLVLAFVGFDALETVRFGGTVNLPGGVGPGAWLGIAGSLLSAQPLITGPAAEDHKFASARIIGYASMLGAVLSFGFNLYWRVRYALHNTGGSADFGKQNIAVIATAVVYGVVALVAVLVASTLILHSTKPSRLATSALGLSTLAAGLIVWILPVGRDIDAFHGIAQNTSTAGVGFEGYLAWAAAAAIFAPRTLFGYRNRSETDENSWQAAARNGLLLITVWCLGSVLMRITDLVVAVTLDYPFSRYDSLVPAAFDLATAVLAIWLRINLANDSVSARLITSLCGLVATLSISRVVVGVALAPRFQESPAAQNPVYGNNLAQQITSTFDVVLCGLGLSILVAAVVTGQLGGRRLQRQKRRAARSHAAKGVATPSPSAAPTTRVRVGRTPPPSAAATTRIRTGPPGADTESPTTVTPQPASTPRIFRGNDSATRQTPVQKPKIYRPPQDSR